MLDSAQQPLCTSFRIFLVFGMRLIDGHGVLTVFQHFWGGAGRGGATCSRPCRYVDAGVGSGGNSPHAKS